MGLSRALLLAGARSAWLRDRAGRWRFVRRSVSRFMPGETLGDALSAATGLRARGIGTILTHLGENVATPAEALAVKEHYVDALRRIADAGIDARVSVKLTQLGLDAGVAPCLDNLLAIALAARSPEEVVWIDMESSQYVDRTIEVFRRARERLPNVGLCLQSYLRRTESDLETLLPLAPAIRLVKGAYREPASAAFPRKRDVDENYARLATRVLAEAPTRPGTFLGMGTHDVPLIERILRDPAVGGGSPGCWEIEMLYGIRAADVARLAASGRRVRVLISYGESWFPWYMRRLAERPANVLFVARNLFRR